MIYILNMAIHKISEYCAVLNQICCTLVSCMQFLFKFEHDMIIKIYDVVDFLNLKKL